MINSYGYLFSQGKKSDAGIEYVSKNKMSWVNNTVTKLRRLTIYYSFFGLIYTGID